MYFDFQIHSDDGLCLNVHGWRPDADIRAMLCLMHGLGDHGGRYGHVADYLCQHGCALLAMDLRGHGTSDGQRGHTPSYEALMNDIACFLIEAQKRFYHCPTFLYGHSMGGNLVINYALRRRPDISGVIATAPMFRVAFEPPLWKKILGNLARPVWPTLSLSSGLRAEDLSHDPEVVLRYKNDPLVHDRVTPRFLDIRDAGMWALEQAGDFPLPILLMHGSADRIASSQASVEFAAGADARCTLKIWEGLYHEIHNEPEKETVLAHIVEWLETRMNPE